MASTPVAVAGGKLVDVLTYGEAPDDNKTVLVMVESGSPTMTSTFARDVPLGARVVVVV